MSSFLSAGGRTTYGIDLDVIKSSSTSTRTSHSSSPSSTISESSNSTLAISTRKPRTQRKRPKQTYIEAAALLSTAYPNIFPAKDFSKPCKFIQPQEYSSFSFEDSSDELLMPFVADRAGFPIDSFPYEKPSSNVSDGYGCKMNSSNLCDGYDDFDAESILDEEIEEGVIDNIMGNLDVGLKEETNTGNNANGNGGVSSVGAPVDFCYGYPLGLGLGLGGRIDFGIGKRREEIVKAFRQSDEGDWWRFPAVNVSEISPQFYKPLSPPKKKKKKKKRLVDLTAKPSPTQSKEILVPVAKLSSTTSNEVSTLNPESSSSIKENSVSVPKSNAGMLLKLNYNDVLNAWSDKGSPFSEDLLGSEFSGKDGLARLAQIDLFGESGGLREASVQRYKEKRRSRLFSKKIRYQVRKVNADQRPRMKGRFVRRPNSPGSEEQ